VVFAPGVYFSVFIGALTAWALYELAAMFRVRDPLRLLVLTVAGGATALALLSGVSIGWETPAIVIAAVLANIWIVACYGPDRAARHPVINVLAGSLWIGVLFPYFALLRNMPGGVPLVILMLLLVAACDSGAYFTGRSLGRIKLMRRVSPHKTVEGASGGLVACIIAGLVLRIWLAAALSTTSVTFLAAGVAVLAQLGDLTGSAFKRIAGVKDSGWIFPGHGGLLDRTCSLVFAAVFTYYYVRRCGAG
jgi:phosphatidate cytidylyltransferase